MAATIPGLFGLANGLRQLANGLEWQAIDRLAFEHARQVLEDALTQLGNYVNSVAMGDPMIVALSGFPSYTTGHAPDYSPPAAPANLRLRHGPMPGSILYRYQPARTPSMNEVQSCTGDPNVTASVAANPVAFL